MFNPKLSLTVKEFKDWLQKKSPNDVIGKARDMCACPIAKNLKETFNPVYVSVMPYMRKGKVYSDNGVFGTITLEIDESSDTYYSMKLWQAKFAALVDETYNGVVTAKQALKILNKVTKRKND